MSGTIAGVLIPDSALAHEAPEFLRDVSTPLLFDHSRRVSLAMFHDLSLLEGPRTERERFEIDGGNAARAFLERHGRHGSRRLPSVGAGGRKASAGAPDRRLPRRRVSSWARSA